MCRAIPASPIGRRADSSPAVTSGDESSIHLLLIESDRSQALSLHSLLSKSRQEHFTLDWVRSLAAARAFLAHTHPDAIVLDLALSDGDGLSGFQSIHDLAPHVPILVLSGSEDEEAAQQCVEAGAQDYLIHPSGDYSQMLVRSIRYAVERSRREQRLRESEKRLTKIVQCSPLPIVLTSLATGVLLDVNASGCDLFGYSREELIGRGAAEFDVWVHPEEELAILRQIEKGQPCSRAVWFRTRAGKEIHVLASFEIIDLDGEPCVLSILNDITERKRMEMALQEQTEALHESQQRYEQLIQNAPLGIAIFDNDGAISMANPIARRFLHLSEGATLNLFEHPFFVRTGLAETIDRCMEQRKRRVVEVSYSRDREHSLQLRVHLAPVCQDDGTPSAVQVLFEDVTQHRESERQHNHRQKLEAVGALAAGIAHEINTPTQFIGDNVHFLGDAFHDLLRLIDAYRAALRRQASGTEAGSADELAALEAQIDLGYLAEEIPSAIRHTLESVARVADIVNAMRTFAHPVTGIKSPANLNEAILHTLTVARNEYKYVADVETDLDPNLPLVSCDLGEINQVFLNLIVNAAHAIKERIEGERSRERGTITIRTRHVGDDAVISIQDTGTGIPPELESRVFDPFFTTKPVGEGTGQGLAIAHSVIVKKHHGQIGLETAVGKGTTFTIRLPLTEHSRPEMENTNVHVHHSLR